MARRFDLKGGRTDLQMLLNLRRHALYRDIEAAVERYTELPFMLHRLDGVIEGIIDLLYRDERGIYGT
jgi:hypothetical protein